MKPYHQCWLVASHEVSCTKTVQLPKIFLKNLGFEEEILGHLSRINRERHSIPWPVTLVCIFQTYPFYYLLQNIVECNYKNFLIIHYAFSTLSAAQHSFCWVIIKNPLKQEYKGEKSAGLPIPIGFAPQRKTALRKPELLLKKNHCLYKWKKLSYVLTTRYIL